MCGTFKKNDSLKRYNIQNMHEEPSNVFPQKLQYLKQNIKSDSLEIGHVINKNISIF